MLRRTFLFSLLILVSWPCLAGDQLLLPLKDKSVRFAVIGDSGTGDGAQYKLAGRLQEWRARYPFEFVVMLGDNLYGSERPVDFDKKFELPYKPLLDAGVKFYASLGNHDDANQRFYKHFNMGGERYYTFRPKLGVRFFALDSNYMDKGQLEWLQRELRASGSEWKICFFHHPIYSSGGRHGSDVQLRAVLEPLFVEHGVSVVLSGHEHFYERIKPQKGIYYFISGGAGKLARGDIRRTGMTAKGYDQGLHFMVMEIAGDELYFQTISETDTTVDSGVIQRPGSNVTSNGNSGSKTTSNGAKQKPQNGQPAARQAPATPSNQARRAAAPPTQR